MSKSDSTTAIELSELSALDALGVLPTGEATTLRQSENSTLVESETAAYRELVGLLGKTVDAEAAPVGLRDRLLDAVERIEEQDSRGVVLQEPGLLISSAAKMEWVKLELPGVWVKPLFVNEETGYATAMVRLEPGTVYPSHVHSEPEELFVIEGEIEVHGQIMRAGDYCRAEPGTVHKSAFTKSGGLFLVSSSANDEIFADRP